MGFFTSFFDNSESEKSNSSLNWMVLNDANQLDLILEASKEKPVVVFKHSTRCSISRMALKQFENAFDLEDKITPYFLDLLTYRPISNEIASKFEVMHQSPQIIVIKNGRAIFDASHSDIDAEELKNYI